MPYKDPEKRKAYAAQHYQDNTAGYAERRKEYRRTMFHKVNALKDNPCTDCGQKYPYYVMQFDHIGSDKVADVNALMRSKGWPIVEAEIAKCELVCANCHAIRTWERRNMLS